MGLSGLVAGWLALRARAYVEKEHVKLESISICSLVQYLAANKTEWKIILKKIQKFLFTFVPLNIRNRLNDYIKT